MRTTAHVFLNDFTRLIISVNAGFPLQNTSLFYLPERARLVVDLLDAHKADENFKQNYGILLSGPNGVGKSAVGLLSFACCFAQGRLAVYTPFTRSWLEAAQNDRGDEFFLEQFFVQNADKIAATPKLCRVFAARLRGVPVHAKLMVELRAIVNTRPGPSVIVIDDEAQHIANIVGLLKTASISAASERAARYFSTCWLNWDHANICFLRMDIASSHGTREFNLPSGEDHRLRFVDPWPLVIARAALLHKRSPLFVPRTNACERILHVAGGVVRRMFECKNELPIAGRFTLKHLALMEVSIRERMTRDCEHWLLKELDDSQRRVVCNHLPLLLRGELSWKAVKGAYDTGLVYRDKLGMTAVPVSPVASAVMYQVLSTASQSMPPRLASELNASERGYQFEHRVRSHLASCTVLEASTKNFDGTASLNPLHVRLDHFAFFDKLEETASPLIGGVLYSPNDQRCACDAIIVPPTPMVDIDCDIDDATYMGDAEESAHISPSSEVTQSAPAANSTLQVWECSVTNPKKGSRLAKLMRWFEEGGLIAQLRQLHPTRRITAVICWPEFLARSAKTSPACQLLLAAAHEADVSLLVVDQPVLASWGIALSKPAAQYRKQRIHSSNSSIL
jgi:hypothetical protein